MIDLHTHTNYSDGTWNVKKLLHEAEKSKIEVLSITDHDNVKAHIEIPNNDYSDIFSGAIINGVELNVIAYGIKIEILAYNFDVNIIDNWCEKSYNNSYSKKELLKQYRQIITSATERGIVFDKIDYLLNEWPIKKAYYEIKKNEVNKKYFNEKEWNDMNYFIRCASSNADFPVFLDLRGFVPEIDDAIDIIHSAGGKVFLAHLYRYPFNNHNYYLEKLVNDNLVDGIEVCHSDFTDEQSKYLIDYCKKKNLLMSGGSDCHGEKKLVRKIGKGYGNLNIEKSIISNWIYL